MGGEDRDFKDYLARIRKTIADSERAVSQAELRIAETDRMLERNGLTRAQVMEMKFTEAQIEAANEELRRRGMDPIEDWSGARPAPAAAFREPAPEPAEDLSERQRKFGMMMKPFQI